MRKPVSVFITFIAVSLFLYNTHAQVITVVSELTGEPVENVALFNSDRSVSTLSGMDGKANISIFQDNDSITFQHPAYTMVKYYKKDAEIIRKVLLSKKIIMIDEFVISASKFKESKRDVPFKVDVLDESVFGRYQDQNSADILRAAGNISIQKSQGGGGSPIIRGFEANKILLVIDGVRMNNAIYRSGHLQNSITIDHAILERAEILYGPNSLLYGSDALGGVIHYSTRDPEHSKNKGENEFSVRANSQYSSANKGKAFHISLNSGFHKFAFLTGVSHKDLGDMTAGKKSNPFYGDYGKLMHYALNFDGKDSTLANSDPFQLKNTGYSQTDFIQKIKYSPSQYSDLILNFQYSTSSNIDRFDELNDYRGDNMNYAEYYYGPQNRLLASIKTVFKKDNYLFSGMTTTLAFQKIDEDRINRRFGSKDKLVQEEDVNVYSLNIDFNKFSERKDRIYYGLEAVINEVESTAWYENIITGNIESAQTRYPDGGSNTLSLAAYGKYRWFISERLIYSTGIRYQYGYMKSDFSSGILPYNDIVINNGALTGSMSLVFHPGKAWQINTIASSGFRNPNVDDYGKVRAKDNMVTVPNSELGSEYTWNVELGVSKTIEGYIKIDGSAWYTLLTNAIVRTGYRINNSDSLFYDGQMYKIITNSNAGQAYIRGMSFTLLSDISGNLNVKGTLNITEGWNISDDEPLSHIPPVFGRTSITYHLKKFTGDFYIDYSGWKHIEKMSVYGEDNVEEGTEYGFPGWYTLNILTSYNITQKLRLQFAAENILNSLYKPFASAIAGMGRNFIVSIRLDF